VDVRFVAATDRDLEAEVVTGGFRDDLLFRLGAFPVRLPPLRERPDGVLLLSRHPGQHHQADGVAARVDHIPGDVVSCRPPKTVRHERHSRRCVRWRSP